jgi:hypothetical protein
MREISHSISSFTVQRLSPSAMLMLRMTLTENKEINYIVCNTSCGIDRIIHVDLEEDLPPEVSANAVKQQVSRELTCRTIIWHKICLLVRQRFLNTRRWIDENSAQ